jgi:hypothetical protein
LIAESSQQLTDTLIPENNTIVQANITTVGDEVFVPPNKGSRTPMVLPDQTPVQMLSRLRELISFNWTEASTGVLQFLDLELLLRNNTEHSPVLKQYALYRSDFLMFIRINTNQFYSGALMVTWWAGTADYGLSRQNRTILHPVTISASTQQSAEILIAYPFPQEWLITENDVSLDPFNQQVFICIEVLSPLKLASSTLTDTVKVQLYGAYRNPQLQLNRDPAGYSAALSTTTSPFSPQLAVRQSKLEITKKKGDTSFKSVVAASPQKDAASREKVEKPLAFAEIAPTVSSIPIVGTIVGSLYDLLKIGTGTVQALAPTVSSLAPLAPLILDKPESRADAIRAIPTFNYDQFSSDVVDLSVPVTYSRDNYLKMIEGAGIRMGHWTLAQYAALPGIVLNTSYNPALVPTLEVPLFGATPMGYLRKKFRFWKASMKLKFQFFCSAYVSARFALFMMPNYDSSDNFDDYIVKIIDVKGDTTTDVTIPFPNQQTWIDNDKQPYKLVLKVIAPIVGFDVASDSNIGLVVWSAGGPDTQFALPCNSVFTYTPEYLLPTEALARMTPPVKLESPPSNSRALTRADAPPLSKPGVERQSAIQRDFEKPFDPIVSGCSYIVDNAYAVSDAPVTFNDLFKRYQEETTFDPRNIYFTEYAGHHRIYLKCFAARRGGYRMKFQATNLPSPTSFFDFFTNVRFAYTVGTAGPTTSLLGESVAGPDMWHHVSIPWVDKYPWAWYRRNQNVMIKPDLSEDWVWLSYFAFRDDFETGLPLMPDPDA